ncbi:MAG: oxygenase MpaB family protein [Bacteroidota bacterium]
MEFFVNKESIVRKIWGKSDTILFVFAGASAEFALNKAVDWLYFTGRLPSDPLGRLFSTVMYARKIVFSEKQGALNAIDKITAIHSAVENNRNAKIPDWAYRDVLFMLIHYSVASYELLERKITDHEKEDLYDVFLRMGVRMNLKDLPTSYPAWQVMHAKQLNEDLVKSHYTVDLYKQYRKHLGYLRYKILKESQKLVCPEIVCKQLGFGKILWVSPLLWIYKISRRVKLDSVLKSILLPGDYKEQIAALDNEFTPHINRNAD